MSTRTLDIGGRVKFIKRERNQAIVLAVGRNAEKTQSDKENRDPALKTAGCASKDKMIYWCCSINIFGSQLIGH